MVQNLEDLVTEVTDYLASIDVTVDGEHMWDNYQELMAISLRLQQIHNDIAMEEIYGRADPELKKFRTMVLDPAIDRLDKLAAFESRKMTGKRTEWEMENR